MLDYENIRHVELEISSHCNANCPLCPRNLFGYNYNTGYVTKNLSLSEIKTIFPKKFLNKLEYFTLEGNYGDPLMNPQLLDIIKYFDIPCEISTNASLQTATFWKTLASLDVKVYFALDGLKDTHSIYRQNTSYDKIIKNAKIFIDAGGNAVWKMIKFKHNEHQINDCKNLSHQLGFKNFLLIDHGRDKGPVFNKDGDFVRTIGDFEGATSLQHYLDIIEKGDMLIEDIWDKPKKDLDCESIKKQSIYVTSEGEVYPCCYMGFNPRKYGKGRWHQPVNKQIMNIIGPNNALHNTLKECIEWFNNIPMCWNKKSFEEGRLIVCDASCGK